MQDKIKDEMIKESYKYDFKYIKVKFNIDNFKIFHRKL